MRNIELPDDEFERLEHVAQKAGYTDVSAFIRSLVAQPTAGLSQAELADSLDMLRESDADIQAGRTEDLRDALLQIAAKYDLQIQQ